MKLAETKNISVLLWLCVGELEWFAYLKWCKEPQ